jgi:predicted DCC family thiol-disulfide oxidoreductase YuxK
VNAAPIDSKGETAGVLPARRPITVLYDGACRFCTSSVEGLARRMGAGRVTIRDFQERGVLEAYPGITRDAAMQKMHIVLPDGRVFAGAEAAARIARRLPIVGWLAFAYYIPGLRQLADLVYRAVARHRYRLFGRRQRDAGRGAAGTCDGGSCDLHGF